MTKALRLPGKNRSPRMPAQAHLTAEKTDPAFPVRNIRAPVQILRYNKECLDQIIDEQTFRSYEAVMFLIAERQQHLPSDFGVFRISNHTPVMEMIELAVVPDIWIRVE